MKKRSSSSEASYEMFQKLNHVRAHRRISRRPSSAAP
jgi:hypothetical protein